jgi:hypothetical protein
MMLVYGVSAVRVKMNGAVFGREFYRARRRFSRSKSPVALEDCGAMRGNLLNFDVSAHYRVAVVWTLLLSVIGLPIILLITWARGAPVLIAQPRSPRSSGRG